MAARLLIFSRGRENTGLGRIAHGIASALAARYDVRLATVDRIDPAPAPGWNVIPDDDPGDVWIEATVRAIRPELVLMVDGPRSIGTYVEAIRRAGPHVRAVAYVPIDGAIIAPPGRVAIGDVDRLVVYTEFARRALLDAVAVGTVVGRSLAERVEVIGHAVTNAAFRPLADRAAAIREAFGERVDPRDAFVVLNANRNDARKRPDLTLEGFALFARDKPGSVKLCMHMNRRGAVDLVAVIRALDLDERVLLPTEDGPDQPLFSDRRLEVLYNACGVGVSTSTGEGWGLVAFEHALTGAAQVVPNHTAYAELWPAGAEFVPVTARVPVYPFFEGGVVAPAGVAAALERLYADRARLAALQRAAYANANRPEYGWGVVANRWDALLRAVLVA